MNNNRHKKIVYVLFLMYISTKLNNMLLVNTKLEDGTLVSKYDSSNILYSLYDKDKKDLTIVFKQGKFYTYHNVDEVEHTQFEIAESQGKFLNSKLVRVKEFTILTKGSEDVKRLDEVFNRINKLTEEEELTLFKNLLNNVIKNDTYLKHELEQIKLLCERLLK